MHLGSRFYKVSPSYKSTSHLAAMAKRTASFSQIKPITLKSNQIKQQGIILFGSRYYGIIFDRKSLGTVIFLHGLGDTGYGWLKIMEILHKQTPHIKYILPSAPSRPVTINGGMSMPAW